MIKLKDQNKRRIKGEWILNYDIGTAIEIDGLGEYLILNKYEEQDVIYYYVSNTEINDSKDMNLLMLQYIKGSDNITILGGEDRERIKYILSKMTSK